MLLLYMLLLQFNLFRTGRRSGYGILQDGLNSLIRYYKNNFADGFRQVLVLKKCFLLFVKVHNISLKIFYLML